MVQYERKKWPSRASVARGLSKSLGPAGMEIHTNRDLSRMLAGTKPLAAFLLDGGLTEEQALSEQPFQEYVQEGRIIRFEVDITMNGRPMRRLLFALPGQEWRFEAYCALLDLLSEGWSEDKERREGALLGYTDAENDAHIASQRAAKR